LGIDVHRHKGFGRIRVPQLAEIVLGFEAGEERLELLDGFLGVWAGRP
jgi:hypothetical protein